MKIRIEYQYDSKYANKFWAKAFNERGEKMEMGCGKSFELAEANLIEEMRGSEHGVVIPPPKEIEFIRDLGWVEHCSDGSIKQIQAEEKP
jgi:hypothetical protein